MKNQIKKKLSNIFVFAALAAVLSGTAFAQRSDARTRPANNETATKASRQSPTFTNRLAYQIGKDFAFAMYDAKGLDDDTDSLNYTIVDLVYLIDELEGQPEAAQLQSILKSVVRGTKNAAQVTGEIETVAKSYLARQTAEQKWYYSVGHSQINLTIAGYANNPAGIKKSLNELQALTRTAPQGTPKSIVDAMNGLTKYIAKSTFSKDDCTALVTDVKNITNAVYA